MDPSPPNDESQDGAVGITRRLLPRLRMPLGMRRRRLSRPVLAIVATAAAIFATAALTYVSARQFTRSAAETRAGVEATSFAEHSSLLATGDAFNGYLQILRYAEDPLVRARATDPAARRAALQQLLFLNTNRFDALAVADQTGIVLVATDPGLTDIRESQAFLASRASQGPSNSDIIVPQPGRPGYVEYATSLLDADGTRWATLYARADPARVWISALGASVDGGRNVIINSQGQFAAGVPDDELGLDWRGAPFENGAVAATIAGVDSICGLGPIGKDTQIDHGWFIASCLPGSLVQVEANRAMGKQGLVTVAGALLATVIASATLWVIVTREHPVSPRPASSSLADDVPDGSREPVIEPGPAATVASGTPQPPPIPRVVADVNALTLVDAYERRAERAADSLREEVQARLMIIETHIQAAAGAFDEPERAAALHDEAAAQLQELRTHVLRAVSNELHPALVRIGLAGALRALAIELQPAEVAVDIDPHVDAVEDGDERRPLPAALRVALYRLARASLQSLTADAATACDAIGTRDEHGVTMLIIGDASPDIDLTAGRIALEARGGRLRITRGDRSTVIDAWVPVAAPVAGAQPRPSEGSAEAVGVALAPPTAEPVPAATDDMPAPPPASPETPPLPEALRLLAASLEGTLHLELDIDPIMERPSHALPAAVCRDLLSLVRDVVGALTAAGAEGCRAALSGSEDDIFLSLRSTAEQIPDVKLLQPAGEAVEALGGRFTVTARGSAITVTAELPLRDEQADAA